MLYIIDLENQEYIFYNYSERKKTVRLSWSERRENVSKPDQRHDSANYQNLIRIIDVGCKVIF